MSKLIPRFQKLIEAQKMFFVATAAPEGRVNVSPKGMDTLRILSPARIVWLSLTGSGNETAAHVRECGRITLMFCALDGPAIILRVYGQAKTVHPRDKEWDNLADLFPPMAGSRQIFDVAIESVQTSCGTGVPEFTFKRNRGPEELIPFYAAMSEEELRAFWTKKNTQSLDGKNTGIFR
jgi:hypothetical protein